MGKFDTKKDKRSKFYKIKDNFPYITGTIFSEFCLTKKMRQIKKKYFPAYITRQNNDLLSADVNSEVTYECYKAWEISETRKMKFGCLASNDQLLKLIS